MNYRYRVKGVAERFFILRGVFFYASKKIDDYITEQELEFVKERSKLTEIVDLQSKANVAKPMPNNSNEINRGVKNDTQPTIRANKIKPATKV